MEGQIPLAENGRHLWRIGYSLLYRLIDVLIH